MNLISRVWGCFREGATPLITTGPRENVLPFREIRELISPLPVLWESGEELDELESVTLLSI